MKESLGRYKIIKEIGRGAMGVVYEGYDPKIDRIVALKTIRKDRLADSKDMKNLITRFQREVRATGKLVHPNIIVIYDTGEDEETAYIAMEYIEGDTLENLIQKGIRLSMDKIVNIIDQICDGLEFTHRQGIVHRDLKPSNIMLLEGERVKITDFGISKAVGAASSPLTQAGVLLGTPSYMSPEQIAGSTIDGRSDLFSLGIILYQLLTGEKAFAGDTIPSLLYSIVHKEPLPPSQADPAIPPVFDDIVARALAKSPEKRYQTAKDFADDVRRASRGESLKKAATTDLTATVTAGVAETIYRKRRRYGLVVGIGVLLLALGLGGYFWTYRPQKPSKEEIGSRARVAERLAPGIERESSAPSPLPPEESEKREAPPTLGTILVKSDPPGAQVFLDGDRLELPTPTVIEKVTVGEKHELRVEKKGFRPWSDTVEAQADRSLTIEASLARLVGTIIVKSTPSGAVVSVDGKRLEAPTPTIIEKVTAEEKHRIQIAKKGYKTEVQTISLVADERREVKVALELLLGEIRISSAPSGAEVYLNGKDMGRSTPTRLSDLSPGEYTVKLEKEGHKVWVQKVVVKASEPLDLQEVKLKQALGRLNLLVSPWADVYYMGKKLGTTPLANIPFQEGTHTLTLKNQPLKVEKKITVRIIADRTSKKSIDLTSGLKGRLNLRVTPWAHVYIDGKPVGMTPLKPLELMPGAHKVHLKNEALKVERSFTVMIKANEVVSKEVNLLE